MKIQFFLIALCILFSVSLICDVGDSLKTIEVSPKITILEFGADNCYYCKKMKKILNEIKLEFGDSIHVEFVDFNKRRNHRIINKYFIKEIPAQIFLDEENNVFYRHTGFLRKKIMKQKIRENLNCR
jgi:thiol-disulfide isomerase/thioredoxin